MTTTRRAVAIFTSRETPQTLLATVAATRRACEASATSTVIDVIVNGSRTLVDALAAPLARMPAQPALRLWYLALGDKANAWNRYIDTIAPEADLYFCIDGYVRAAPGSLDAMTRELAAHDDAWAATALPTVGRSAASQRTALLAGGSMHGNLYALKASTVALFRRTGFRIPLGLYRNDSLLSAVLMFGGDPAANQWDTRRVVAVRDATWDNDVLSPWSRHGLVTQWHRVRRQAQGVLEMAAVRQHLAHDRQPPEALPGTAVALIDRWRQAHPDDAGALARHPLRRHALDRMSAPRDWSAADAPPERIALPPVP